jgi:peptidoglycan-associated lipoprotein
MRKLLLGLGLLLVVAYMAGCHHPQKGGPVETPTTVEPPAPVQPPAPPPPQQPQAKPEVQEGDFKTVYFDFDKYNVRPDQQMALDANAGILKDNPTMKIKIEGNCDERGTTKYNLALGDKRANSVKTYLVNLGISADRIETISYGKERPVDPGHDEAAWSKNRRADFRITGK